jgi:putative transposase
MYYHLVMVVKYRKKAFNDERSDYAKEIFERIGKEYGIKIAEWNHDVDHIHVMFTAQPKTTLSKFINSYKAASSRLIKEKYPEIKSILWKSAFWSKSYCLLTTGGATIDVIKNYIESQGDNDHSFAKHGIKANRVFEE